MTAGRASNPSSSSPVGQTSRWSSSGAGWKIVLGLLQLLAIAGGLALGIWVFGTGSS